jgi:multiple sugar transport system ATP-binding protein
MKTSVSVKDLTLAFGATTVLQNLNLEVSEGEFIVLLGPSGCGKSTLLNCIAGLLEISDGQIHIKGRNVTWDEPSERGIGMVFQSYALYPQMTVRKNLSFGLQIAGTPKAEIEKRVARAAEILQIEPYLDRKPMALSGGQRQRVAIGRALVRDVDVFLFDEPLSNLDAKLRAELRVEIKRLHARLQNTMIYVTHDQIEALTLADRIAIMKGGVIQQLDAPLTIYNKPANLYVAGFIGSPSMNFLRGTISGTGAKAAFVSNGVKIPLDSYQAETKVADGQDVVLGVRPEHIVPGAAKGLEATIDIEEPMGSDSLVWMKLAGHPVCARIASDHNLKPGESTKVEINLKRASLFDAASENRL